MLALNKYAFLAKRENDYSSYRALSKVYVLVIYLFALKCILYPLPANLVNGLPSSSDLWKALMGTMRATGRPTLGYPHLLPGSISSTICISPIFPPDRRPLPWIQLVLDGCLVLVLPSPSLAPLAQWSADTCVTVGSGWEVSPDLKCLPMSYVHTHTKTACKFPEYLRVSFHKPIQAGLSTLLWHSKQSNRLLLLLPAFPHCPYLVSQHFQLLYY